MVISHFGMNGTEEEIIKPNFYYVEERPYIGAIIIKNCLRKFQAFSGDSNRIIDVNKSEI